MKKTLPAAAVLTILAGVVTVQAQDPLTYVDENGETVTYGEEQDWVRTIHYVFPDCPRRNHDLEQYTRGSEVWIKPADGPAEYHIGNNGECGWDAVMTPVEAGFSADIELVPEADLYADPGQAQKAEITVTYVSRQPEKTGNPEIPGTVKEETAAPEITVSQTPVPAEPEEPAKTSHLPAAAAGILVLPLLWKQYRKHAGKHTV
ncbi:MAG: hypothetical protein IIY47_10205 [Solobacterium sp.]|nr:hypothetical protein [Solobacterium sp.]